MYEEETVFQHTDGLALQSLERKATETNKFAGINHNLGGHFRAYVRRNPIDREMN